ncbi:glycosyl hydrolase family 61-domain-containing protein [Microdochium bolleyi]|uniref:lytic cellulose monooxygenase (C4-dehydrogenating) n=1 Tax=Microdochium bolleyi TaxID=196109 RepID=A0A136J520_9PEZI|nr:glycosyl hydrolase family 61-domain-containing protein [Microdochium bolleyi]
MKWSQNIAVIAAAVATQQASAHSIFTTLFVNEVSQGDATCVRMNPSPGTCTNPVPDLQGEDMACGIGGSKAVAFTCPAPAGSKLTFQWRLWANAEQPGVIDKSHMGPCAVYAKYLGSSSTASAAAGGGWIKLWHEGYDSAAGKWCTEKLIDNNGLLSIDLAPGLTAGNWLFRPELLALQNTAQGDPQFYVGCAQVFVESTVKEPLKVPDKYQVSIPGHVSYGHPSTTFDVWNPKFPYTMPGPEVYAVPSPANPGGGGARGGDAVVVTQTAGKFPDAAIARNGNWAGFEVPAFSDEMGCWRATEDCWKQCEACYAEAPVTGNGNCVVFEGKCTKLNAQCEGGQFKGPQGAGVRLESADPPPPEWFPPAVNAGQGTGSGSGGSGGGGGGGGGGDNVVVEHPPPPVSAPVSGGDGHAVTVTVTVTARAPQPTGVLA